VTGVARLARFIESEVRAVFPNPAET
jgi:hypothetical protein